MRLGICSGSAGSCTALLQVLRSPCSETAGPWEQAATVGPCDRAVAGPGVGAVGLVSLRDWWQLPSVAGWGWMLMHLLGGTALHLQHLRPALIFICFPIVFDVLQEKKRERERGEKNE